MQTQTIIANDAERAFHDRLVRIHGKQLDADSTEGDSSMDVHHEEIQAMVESFLGADYDVEKIQHVFALQDALHQGQASLVGFLTEQAVTPEGYVDQFNQLLLKTFVACEKVLGRQDFERLFGAAPSDLQGYIDKETFLSPDRGVPSATQRLGPDLGLAGMTANS